MSFSLLILLVLALFGGALLWALRGRISKSARAGRVLGWLALVAAVVGALAFYALGAFIMGLPR